MSSPLIEESISNRGLKSRGVIPLIGWRHHGTRFSARSVLCPRLDSGDPPDALAALSRTIRQHHRPDFFAVRPKKIGQTLRELVVVSRYHRSEPGKTSGRTRHIDRLDSRSRFHRRPSPPSAFIRESRHECVLVSSRSREILRCVRKTDWFGSKQPIDQQSLACYASDGEPLTEEMEQVATEAWFPELPPNVEFEVYEQRPLTSRICCKIGRDDTKCFWHRHSGRRVNHQNNTQTRNENPHRLLLPLRTRF